MALKTDAWRDYALHLRKVLEMVGVSTPECLPGEADDCGSDYGHHCLGYLAMLKAKADDGLWHMHHGEGGGTEQAELLYGHWRKELANSGDCDRCRTSLEDEPPRTSSR